MNETKKRKLAPAWIILGVIALTAGLLLGATNLVTADRIAEQSLIAAEEARKTVFPGADSFNKLDTAEDALVDYCYEAVSGGSIVGHVSQVTVTGYGGEIEVTVGVDLDGVVTGISVGGANFSETAGLGAKTKNAAFTDQFIGMLPPLAVTKDGGEVDAVTGATKSSRAVTNGVNTAVEYVLSLN